MLNKKSLTLGILTIAILIGGVAAILFFTHKEEPKSIIESKMNIELLPSMEILNFDYSRKEDYFDAKILIPDKEILYIKGQLNNFFTGPDRNLSINDIPNFINICPWWDLQKSDIQEIYDVPIDIYKLFYRTSHQVYAFISRDKTDQYYLYISY
jgi:hypothetical protein